jgi:hypothetical protein
VGELNITARFARDAEFTEVNGFSIAVDPAHLSGTGTPAMEKHSAAFAAEKGRSDKLYRDLVCNSDAAIVKGLCDFAFRRLSEKQNKKQQLCVLRVSAVRRCPGPFRVDIKPPF